ncbi:MAG: hypothetical protein JEZ04_16425 [Spirochaetales bacterium]|nr:hypothetical protein [Spirochaetales bacterium]
MKKVICIGFILLVFTTVFISADEVIWGSMYSEGNINLGADVAYEVSGTMAQLALYPAAEMIFLKPMMGDLGFLDIGATVKGRVGVPLSFGTSLSAGVGALASLHFGLRGLDIPGSEYFERLDLFAEIGLKFDIIPSSLTDTFGLAFSSGVNYFLDDNIAVGATYTNWGGFNGGGASVFLKLGEKPAVKGIDVDWQETPSVFAVQPYLLQFYTLFYSAHFAGGFYPNDYPEGKGTVHRITLIEEDDESSYFVEKALLRKLSDGRMLWMMDYRDDEDSVYYEFITDAEYKVITVYFRSDEDGILELPADDELYPQSRYMTWEDYGADVKKGVSIDVKAGRFKTDEYNYEDGTGVRVSWWLSGDVPGQLVSYMMEDSSDIVTSELIEITKSNKASLYMK